MQDIFEEALQDSDPFRPFPVYRKQAMKLIILIPSEH
jgi:hypothetical protein